MAEAKAAPPKGEAEAAPAKGGGGRLPSPRAAPAGPGFEWRISPHVLVWIAMTYGRDMLAGPQQVEKASENAPSAARAPPVHHRDAVDEEFGRARGALKRRPSRRSPPRPRSPSRAVPAVPRSAADERPGAALHELRTQREPPATQEVPRRRVPADNHHRRASTPRPPSASSLGKQIAGMAQIATLALMIGGGSASSAHSARRRRPGTAASSRGTRCSCLRLCLDGQQHRGRHGRHRAPSRIVVGDRTIYSKLAQSVDYRTPRTSSTDTAARRPGRRLLEAKYSRQRRRAASSQAFVVRPGGPLYETPRGVDDAARLTGPAADRRVPPCPAVDRGARRAPTLLPPPGPPFGPTLCSKRNVVTMRPVADG